MRTGHKISLIYSGIAIGLLLSAEIELTQFVFRLGVCELDDVLNNTIGAAIGSLLFKKFGKRIEQLCTRLKELES